MAPPPANPIAGLVAPASGPAGNAVAPREAFVSRGASFCKNHFSHETVLGSSDKSRGFSGVILFRSSGVQEFRSTDNSFGNTAPWGMGNALQEEIVNAIVL